MLIETNLKLSGDDLKDATVIGFSGSNGKFDFIQIKLRTGKNVELRPYKLGTNSAMIETIETIWKPQ